MASCKHANATNNIDQHAADWTDLGPADFQVIRFLDREPRNRFFATPLTLCVPICFATSAQAVTHIRLTVDGQASNPSCETRVRLGSGEMISVTLATCINFEGGQNYTIRAQFKTQNSGNSCFQGTRSLQLLEL